jgi:RNA polymerase sigma-70 factor (ECF subfamily)
MRNFRFDDASRKAAWQDDAGPRPEIAGRLIAVWKGARTVTDWSDCIVAIAERRDRQQFAALFAHFGPRLKGFFLRRGLAAGAAEDLMQETLLIVWRKADRFDPQRAGASTWIFTIARNLSIDLRRRERDPGLLAEFYDGADQPTPGELLLSAERDGRIRQALAALPADQAEVVRLSFFEDRPHSQIAEDLRIPLGTVKSRVRLAMMRLRALVEERQ